MKTKALIRKLATRFPKRLADKGDHIGLMTGQLKEETRTIVVCLDFDEEVMHRIEQLENPNVDLILTHHPYLYGTRYRVFKSDEIKKRLTEKVDALKIPIYSMHTNFDSGKDGMNDALASALGLLDVKPLETAPMARGGRLRTKMKVENFAKEAAQLLKVPYGLLTSAGKQEIQTVAIIGGGGSYFYQNALLEGYDLYISGDAPHHVRRDIIARKYNYLDLPHEIERIFISQMSKILQEMDSDLEIIAINHEETPKVIKAS
ncbi:MAG: Nif3-like dinuclear metal center hexameric protein [Erysipelotrichia bacterium]|jgi:dinuclear metal center YbgI/SA1388 family protein|nr:Nif3-like dinuclear metal center hexameric protein [Erysipelotrichia bacterium]